jgi:hypothetical protein
LPLELHEQSATLTGVVVVEDVEQFVTWLRTAARPRVNLRNCTHLHTGAFQALLLFRPPVDPFLANQLMPLLTQSNQRPGPNA